LCDEEKHLPLYATEQAVDCFYYKCPYTLQTEGRDMVSNPRDEQHYIDHILELIFDPESEKEFEGTEYQVTPHHRVYNQH
jgi:hypothetical protein